MLRALSRRAVCTVTERLRVDVKRIQINAVSNLAGRAANAVLTLAFVPFYLQLLGAEAYGLVGFFYALQSTLMLADLGLAAAFTREAARLSVRSEWHDELVRVARAGELALLIIGPAVVLAIVLLSAPITDGWIGLQTLDRHEVILSIAFMGGAIAAQLYATFYQEGLNGLQRQVVVNVVIVLANLLRGVGGILALLLWDADLRPFFLWHVLVAVAQLFVLRIIMWRHFPQPTERSRPSLAALGPLWRFAGGTAAIGATSVVLTQMDKLLVSKLVPLEEFAYFSLASMAAAVPAILAGPISNAVYPRLAQLVDGNSWKELSSLYHDTSQFVAVIVIPLGVTIHMSTYPLIHLWIGDQLVAEQVSPILKILVVGSTLLALMVIPYRLQLAAGWTRLPLGVNIVAILILGPALVVLTQKYGPIGAAWIWLTLNLGYVIGTIQLMHRRLLPGEKWAWYVDDIGKPALGALLAAILLQHLLAGWLQETGLRSFIALAGTFTASFFAAVLISPAPRRALKKLVLKL